MIPRRIHYCWFGPSDPPDSLTKIMDTWRRYCPDYEITLWDESSFAIDSTEYTRSAYSASKYSKVSNYVRAWALFRHGGVYLDTDVEVKANLDEFLIHEAFAGFEAPGLPFSALWASAPGHRWPELVLEEYDRAVRIDEPTNTELTTQILAQEFGIDPSNDKFQMGSHGVVIYPSSHFSLDLPRCFATHHFDGSWLGQSEPIDYKTQIHASYYQRELARLFGHSGLVSGEDFMGVVGSDDFMRLTGYRSQFRLALRILSRFPEVAVSSLAARLAARR